MSERTREIDIEQLDLGAADADVVDVRKAGEYVAGDRRHPRRESTPRA